MAQHGPMGGPMGLWRGGHFGDPMGDATPDNATGKD